MRLAAVDARAASLGLYPGQALADARAMIPELAVIRENPAADKKLLEEVADWCERYTPLVALDPPNGLFLDITGTTHLFGGEAAMLQKIAAAFRANGFSARLALAGTANTARALSRYAPNTCVPPGHEHDAVASIPTEALATNADIIHALKRAGLKTIGQVAERSRHELVARFGKNFIAVLDATCGRIQTPIAPRLPLPDLMTEQGFAEPVVSEEIIASTLLSLGESLARVLETRGEGARAFEASFFRADGQMRRIAIETGQPLRNPQTITRLFREKLDALIDPLNPGFGFDLIRLSATLSQKLEVVHSSFDTERSDPDIALLADKLAARFGSARVLRFQPQDTHIPEAACIAVPAQYAEKSKHGWRTVRTSHEAPRRPLRLFAKPEPVEVWPLVLESLPRRFRWRRAFHIVKRVEGPERIAMEWWRQQERQPTRDYFRIEDENGRRFWLYRDGLPGRETVHPCWYVHGLFG
jgi:protein ImuB